MTSHELARKLLLKPDIEIQVHTLTSTPEHLEVESISLCYMLAFGLKGTKDRVESLTLAGDSFKPLFPDKEYVI